MTDRTGATQATALEQMLRDEREMILSGRFDGLGDLAGRKLEALARLPDWGLPGPRMAAIAEQVTRNQSLLEAAIRGMSAARTRIETVIGAAGTLSTYDSRGRKADLARPPGAMAKKA